MRRIKNWIWGRFRKEAKQTVCVCVLSILATGLGLATGECYILSFIWKQVVQVELHTGA